MEEALQKLKELKLKRHSGVSEDEDDLEGNDKYQNDDHQDEEYDNSDRDEKQYEHSYRSSNERHSYGQQRGGEEFKQL